MFPALICTHSIQTSKCLLSVNIFIRSPPSPPSPLPSWPQLSRCQETPLTRSQQGWFWERALPGPSGQPAAAPDSPRDWAPCSSSSPGACFHRNGQARDQQQGSSPQASGISSVPFMDLLSPPLPVPRPAPGRPLGLEKCPRTGLLGVFLQCPEFWGTRSLRQHLAGSIATPPQSLALLHGVLNSVPSLAFPQCPPACQRT